jgi:tRNA(Ile)-lysidine synthase
VARSLDAEDVLHPGERVVVACSGGPDSTVLVDVLARLAPPRRLDLLVAHVDHGIRAGSAAEAEVVAALAEARGLAFAALAVRVPPGSSLQDRARRARHAALRDLAGQRQATAIAMGHTADDQAETVLMRLLRGTTPLGVSAMGVRDGALARPLLGVWREEVLAYCAALGLEPIDDPSNRDPRFLRSRLRHEVIPLLEMVVPGARRHLVALAARQRRWVREGAASPRDGLSPGVDSSS